MPACELVVTMRPNFCFRKMGQTALAHLKAELLRRLTTNDAYGQ